MKDQIQQVHDFHQATQAAIYDGKPRGIALRTLREDLLRSEIAEADTGKTMFLAGDKQGGIQEMIDGFGDTLYIVSGTAVAYGPLVRDRLLSADIEAGRVVEGDEKALRGDPMEFALQAVERLKGGLGHYLVAESNNKIASIGDILASMADTASLGIEHLGYDPVAVFSEIHSSNMSKLVSSEEEEIATIESYGALGVSVKFVGDFPNKAVLSAETQHGPDGKDYPLDKVLKSVSFRGPDFKHCRLGARDALLGSQKEAEAQLSC